MKLISVLCTCLVWLCMANVNAQSCCASGSSACSVGCSSSTSILPELEKHIIGLNYSYSSYNTTTYSSSDLTGDGIAAKGISNTLQLYGRFNLPKRFQISVSVPVHFLKESSYLTRTHSIGLGDMSAMAFYSVLNPVKFIGKKNKHQLRLGAGIKAPTGKFSMNPDGLFTTDLQLGTGSVDFLFNVNYTYRYRQLGLNATSSYRKNLVNSDHYQFGDNVAAGVSLFYVFNVHDVVTITPKAGATYNHMFYNVYNKMVLTGTGGDALRATAGIDIYYKNFVFSSSVAPVLITVNNWQGESVPVLSYEAGVYYCFNQFSKNKTKKK